MTRPEIPVGGPVSGWWAYLEERTCREVDADVLRDRRLSAVRSVWEALRPLGVGLYEAERVVHARYEALGDRVQRTPPDPLDLSSLAARAAVLPGCVAAVEALWDGDTVHDWFVLLVAVLDAPDGEGHLATVYHRPDGAPLAVPQPRPAKRSPATSVCRSTSLLRTSLMTTPPLADSPAAGGRAVTREPWVDHGGLKKAGPSGVFSPHGHRPRADPAASHDSEQLLSKLGSGSTSVVRRRSASSSNPLHLPDLRDARHGIALNPA